MFLKIMLSGTRKLDLLPELCHFSGLLICLIAWRSAHVFRASLKSCNLKAFLTEICRVLLGVASLIRLNIKGHHIFSCKLQHNKHWSSFWLVT